MTDLRDQFAMAAMQGQIANGWMKDQETIAEVAYKQADAMILEREKDNEFVVLSQAEFSNIRAELINCKAQLQALLEARK